MLPTCYCGPWVNAAQAGVGLSSVSRASRYLGFKMPKVPEDHCILAWQENFHAPGSGQSPSSVEVYLLSNNLHEDLARRD
jgi:hypothetical protein